MSNGKRAKKSLTSVLKRLKQKSRRRPEGTPELFEFEQLAENQRFQVPIIPRFTDLMPGVPFGDGRALCRSLFWDTD